MKNKVQAFQSYFQYEVKIQNRIYLSCLILSYLLLTVNSSDILTDSTIKTQISNKQLRFSKQLNNESTNIFHNESSRMLYSDSNYYTDSDIQNNVMYSDTKINQLDIDQEYRLNQKTKNGTYFITNYKQYKYIYIDFHLDNEENIINYNKLNSIRLHANLDIPAQYNQQKQIVSQFFDSNGFLQKKSQLYLLINQDQLNDSKKIYITLIFDQPSNQMPINYKYRLKISGHNNSKPCPNGCSQINGKCINGICKCQQQYIDEDCSKNAFQVEMNSLQTKLLFKETTIQYIYINVDQDLSNYQLQATLTTNDSKLPTCILYQQENSNCNGNYCSNIPTLNDKIPQFCIRQNSLQNSQEFLLNEKPVTFKKGQQIIIGIQQHVSFLDVTVYVKLQLIENFTESSSESDDIITMISISCSILVTFAMVFICISYCKNRRQQQNNNLEDGQLQSITDNSVQIDMKKQLIQTKKLDKKVLDKYLPAQLWEEAKQILLKENREITDPFSFLLCHSNIENNEKVRMSMCLHVLHEECFDQWFINKECCPMCRRDHKICDLEENEKNKSEINQSDEYMCEMAKQFDQISKQINQSSPKQTQSNSNLPKFIKKNSFIQQINVNFLQKQQPQDSSIQMQEIKINPQYQSQKQLSQNNYTHGLIYYKNNPIRKSSTNSDRSNTDSFNVLNRKNSNNNRIKTSNENLSQKLSSSQKQNFDQVQNNQNGNSTNELTENSYKFEQKQEQDSKIESNNQINNQNNNNDIASSPSQNSIQESPIQKNQIGRLLQRSRLNSSSSENSPHSAGLKYKRGQNANQTSNGTIFNNKLQKTIFIKEVESDDEDNPNENKIQQKKDQFISDNMTLNYIQDIESMDDIKQNQISTQNFDYVYADNINRSKKFSLASSGSDFSMFSPINFRKYRESSAKVFENEGSLNLDIVDNKHEQIQNNNIKLFKQLSNQSIQGETIGNLSQNKNLQDLKVQKQDNKLSVPHDMNIKHKLGQNIILQQLEQTNSQSHQVQIKNILPQDQL